ncbi:hypothetical protein NOF04DRAFT_1333739 [Fusarium oxysporum II5]|nr:hypothetical protein NOF04DRAFT_1333739 [Fusarium oxysporum II5]
MSRKTAHGAKQGAWNASCLGHSLPDDGLGINEGALFQPLFQPVQLDHKGIRGSRCI